MKEKTTTTKKVVLSYFRRFIFYYKYGALKYNAAFGPYL